MMYMCVSVYMGLLKSCFLDPPLDIVPFCLSLSGGRSFPIKYKVKELNINFPNHMIDPVSIAVI